MSQFALHRRTFLRGLGATIALPMLDAMRPLAVASAADPAGAAPVRMAFVFFPNGAIMPDWKPEQAGADYKLSKTLSALEPFKSELNVITGLAQDNGRAKGDGPGDHARCASSFLTGAHPFKTSGANIRVGRSVDQAAAAQVGSRTRLPSLEMGLEQGRTAGSCDSGYSCAYSSAISWKTESTPMAKEINPRQVFERLFGSRTDSEAQRERDFYRRSILDAAGAEAGKLRGALGQSDRRKLDEYFTSVRELEQRIERAEQFAQVEAPELDLPRGAPADLTDHMHLMYDLLALAFQTDTTRIATFMLGNAGNNRNYRMVGVREGHHQLSHHRNDKETMDSIQKIDRYLVEGYAYFLKKLSEIREGERTLLDNSMIVYGSGLSDGNRHRHDDLPVVMAGRGGGSIETGRHIRLEHETPMNNLFLSMLDRMQAGIDSIGDSTGRLTLS